MSATGSLFWVDRLALKRNLPIHIRAAFSVLALCAVAATGGRLAKAQTAGGSTLYRLNTDSDFMQGCFPPCLCPVMIGLPVSGTFSLTPTGMSGFFHTYAVTEVNWLVPINGTAKLVTGSGTYKVGGESALQQELSLDLQIGGGTVQHFDSGLVADTTPFPNIKVTISVHGQVCFDTVFKVSASPVPLDIQPGRKNKPNRFAAPLAEQ